MADIQIYSITTNSAVAEIVNLDTAYSKDDRYVTYYLNGQEEGVRGLDAGVSSGAAVTFRNLESNTYYRVEAVIAFEGGEVTLRNSFETEKPPRPSKFRWSTTPESGKLVSECITASDWGDLQDNVNEVREYMGVSRYNGFSAAYIGNPITASIYNQVVNAIKGIPGYGAYVYTKNSGDRMYASDFIALQDEINAVEL